MSLLGISVLSSHRVLKRIVAAFFVQFAFFHNFTLRDKLLTLSVLKEFKARLRIKEVSRQCENQNHLNPYSVRQTEEI